MEKSGTPVTIKRVQFLVTSRDSRCLTPFSGSYLKQVNKTVFDNRNDWLVCAILIKNS